MTSRQLDLAVMGRRLRIMSDIVDSFAQVEDLQVEGITPRSIERYAAERMMTQLVDLATDINAHLASTILHRAPEEYADGFRLAARILPLPEETATELGLAARMRNVSVHQHVDLDPDRFAAALPRYGQSSERISRSSLSGC